MVFEHKYAVFLGNDDPRYAMDFFTTSTFFLALETSSGIEKQELQTISEKIVSTVEKRAPRDLQSFNEALDEVLEDVMDKEGFTCTCGYVVENVLYVKTYGSGQVYVYREGVLTKVIEDKSSASGFIQSDDLYVFCSARFSRLFDTDALAHALKVGDPKGIVEEITPKLKGGDDVGAIALFVKLAHKAPEVEVEPDAVEVFAAGQTDDQSFVPQESARDLRSKRFHALRAILSNNILRLRDTTTRGKRLTLVIVILVIAILIWSVLLGAKRRAHNQTVAEIESGRSSIQRLFDEAEEVSILDRPKASQILVQAKGELTQLNEKLGDDRSQVASLQKELERLENAILQREEKQAEEFYDLELATEGAVGDSLYRDGDDMAVLDSKNGRVYTISLSKKSVETIQNSAAKTASDVAGFNGVIFLFNPADGIVKVDEGRAVKVIDGKSDWTNATDLAVFNGNIYVLDAANGQIYKYVVVENGYSSKQTYIRDGSAIGAGEGKGIVIDGAIYVLGKTVEKYLSGVSEPFAVDVPNREEASFDLLHTDQNTSKIYVIDKKKSLAYVLSKDGQYERQIFSEVFADAESIIAYEEENVLIVLVGSTVYSVSTN